MSNLASSAAATQIELTINSETNELLIDSRVVATQLDVNHSDWMKNIVRKYQTEIEQAFGILRFENGEIKGKGQPEKFVYLTEDQALFLLTLSRNSPVVVQCKANLIKAFAQARRDLEGQNKSQQPSLPASYLDALKALVSSEEEKLALTAANEELAAAKAALEPKATGFDLLIASGNNMTMAEFCKTLAIPELGRTNMFKWLREHRYLRENNEPYQNHVTSGIFVTIQKTLAVGFSPKPVTLVTPKGAAYLYKKLAAAGFTSPKLAS